ncbi:MaoC family dehydratase [Chondrinema litorale]|uniref:MaoC family dehydratase n=1 Tax=Chondrinema litorale TaxID=2994555 RepID=UPI0025437F2C|nr:MaoC family dehydratase [Chondrinema litorale]UZR93495.1 MaoC family dehydratase [Chondrinema litorale]
MIEQNQTYEHQFKFTQEQVDAFIKLSGDDNPIHYDSEYAAKTVFKKPVIHGILSASVFSKVLGTLFPGEGSIYMKQNLDFLRPMYCEVDYVAEFVVSEIDTARHTAEITTTIKDVNTKKVVVKGSAKVMNKEKI